MSATAHFRSGSDVKTTSPPDVVAQGGEGDHGDFTPISQTIPTTIAPGTMPEGGEGDPSPEDPAVASTIAATTNAPDAATTVAATTNAPDAATKGNQGDLTPVNQTTPDSELESLARSLDSFQ